MTTASSALCRLLKQGPLRLLSTPPRCIRPAVCVRFLSSSEKVPAEDYYHGHLMADRLEYLNDMIEKAEAMEENLQKLTDTYGQKKQAFSTQIKWTDTDDIERLFDQAALQKQDLKQQLAELKALMKDAQKTFAVEAPDGSSDVAIQDELEEVKHIIEDASVLEDPAEIERMHQQEQVQAEEALKTFAVDSPDGQPDDLKLEELEEVQHMIDDAAELEDKEAIEKMHKAEERADRESKKTFAVDSPDGWADGQKVEELEEIQHIIDDAADLEDKEEVEKLHKAEALADKQAKKTFAVDSPDGLPDDVKLGEIEEVMHIIDDAADLENKNEVEKLHKMEEAVRKDRARDPEHDW